MQDQTTTDHTTIAVTAPAAAPPVQVWDVLTRRTPEWWGVPYLAPDADTMHLEAQLGGRVHTGGDPESGDLHGTIRAFDPPGRLEIGGVLVPGGYSGSITFTIEKTKLGSEICVEQTALGRIEAAVEERMSHGWTTMLHTLAALADQ